MKARRWVVFGAALLLSVLTARLGFWQLDRAAQKTALQQSLDEQRKLPALTMAELALTADQTAQQLHRAVVLQGQWLQEHTVYLENRPMNGRVGFFAVTPLKLADGTVVLVQRGWFARDLLDRLRIVAPPAPSGPQRVQGRIALAPSRLYEFESAGGGAIRQNLSVTDFGRETGLPLRPLTVVQEDAAGTAADGLLRQWAPPSLGVDKHHGYAFQWFALSALSAGLWLWLQVLQPRRRRAAQTAAQRRAGPQQDSTP
jgi:surfeit locus 1 family protein